jgi:hypothetical protein
VNGDGFADVIVGAPFYDSGSNGEGAAFLFPGSAAGVVGHYPGDPGTTQLEGDHAAAAFGLSVASAGDVNGDG